MGRDSCLLTPRPCAMVVPDFELICEIMLVAEGFLEARLLARKFITLYTLCKELLSKQVRSSSSWGILVKSQGTHTSVSAFPSSESLSAWSCPLATIEVCSYPRPHPHRITTTGACEPSSPCWWWPAP